MAQRLEPYAVQRCLLSVDSTQAICTLSFQIMSFIIFDTKEILGRVCSWFSDYRLQQKDCLALLQSLPWYFCRSRPTKRTVLGPYVCTESRPRKSAQGDKWSFCLTAGTL